MQYRKQCSPPQTTIYIPGLQKLNSLCALVDPTLTLLNLSLAVGTGAVSTLSFTYYDTQNYSQIAAYRIKENITAFPTTSFTELIGDCPDFYIGQMKLTTAALQFHVDAHSRSHSPNNLDECFTLTLLKAPHSSDGELHLWERSFLHIQISGKVLYRMPFPNRTPYLLPSTSILCVYIMKQVKVIWNCQINSSWTRRRDTKAADVP